MAANRDTAPSRRRRRRRQWAGLLYIAPAIGLVAAFFIVPLVMTAWMSLYNWPLIGLRRWVGFGNYLTLWNDRGFWHALRFTVLYTVAATIGLLSVGLAFECGFRALLAGCPAAWPDVCPL